MFNNYGILLAGILSAASVFALPGNTDQIREEPVACIGQDTGQEQTSVKDTSAVRKIPWNRMLVAGINLTQTAFDNWAKGGQNSFAWSVRLDAEFNRQKEHWGWNLTNNMLYGQSQQQGEKARSTMDKIDMNVVLTSRKIQFLNPYCSLGLLTQFATGYDYRKTPFEPKSDFFDPAYITQGLGAKVSYKNILDSHLGLGFKETVTWKYNQYSDDPGTEKKEKFKFETGIESRSHLNANLIKNINIRSKLDLFSSFEHLNIIDVIWDTQLVARLNQYVVVTLNLLMNYDKDVIDKVQIKEMMAIGLTYKFF